MIKIFRETAKILSAVLTVFIIITANISSPLGAAAPPPPPLPGSKRGEQSVPYVGTSNLSFNELKNEVERLINGDLTLSNKRLLHEALDKAKPKLQIPNRQYFDQLQKTIRNAPKFNNNEVLKAVNLLKDNKNDKVKDFAETQIDTIIQNKITSYVEEINRDKDNFKMAPIKDKVNNVIKDIEDYKNIGFTPENITKISALPYSFETVEEVHKKIFHNNFDKTAKALEFYRDFSTQLGVRSESEVKAKIEEHRSNIARSKANTQNEVELIDSYIEVLNIYREDPSPIQRMAKLNELTGCMNNIGKPNPCDSQQDVSPNLRGDINQERLNNKEKDLKKKIKAKKKFDRLLEVLSAVSSVSRENQPKVSYKIIQEQLTSFSKSVNIEVNKVANRNNATPESLRENGNISPPPPPPPPSRGKQSFFSNPFNNEDKERLRINYEKAKKDEESIDIELEKKARDPDNLSLIKNRLSSSQRKELRDSFIKLYPAKKEKYEVLFEPLLRLNEKEKKIARENTQEIIREVSKLNHREFQKEEAKNIADKAWDKFEEQLVTNLGPIAEKLDPLTFNKITQKITNNINNLTQYKDIIFEKALELSIGGYTAENFTEIKAKLNSCGKPGYLRKLSDSEQNKVAARLIIVALELDKDIKKFTEEELETAFVHVGNAVSNVISYSNISPVNTDEADKLKASTVANELIGHYDNIIEGSKPGATREAIKKQILSKKLITKGEGIANKMPERQDDSNNFTNNREDTQKKMEQNCLHKIERLLSIIGAKEKKDRGEPLNLDETELAATTEKDLDKLVKAIGATTAGGNAGNIPITTKIIPVIPAANNLEGQIELPASDKILTEAFNCEAARSESSIPEAASRGFLALETVSIEHPVSEIVSIETLQHEAALTEPPAPETVSIEPPVPETVTMGSFVPESISTEPLIAETVSIADSLNPETMLTESLALEATVSESRQLEEKQNDIKIEDNTLIIDNKESLQCSNKEEKDRNESLDQKVLTKNLDELVTNEASNEAQKREQIMSVTEEVSDDPSKVEVELAAPELALYGAEDAILNRSNKEQAQAFASLLAKLSPEEREEARENGINRERELSPIAGILKPIMENIDFRMISVASYAGVAAGDENDPFIKQGIWISGTYGRIRQRKFDIQSSGYKGQLAGITIGADAALADNEDNLAGIAYSNIRSEFLYKNKKSGDRISANSHIGSIYGQRDIGSNLIARAIGSFALSNIKAKIHKIVSGKIANSKFRNKTYDFQANLGYKIGSGDGLILIPDIGVKYTNSNDSAYTNVGAGVENHSVGVKSNYKWNATLGGRLFTSVISFASGIKIKPMLSVYMEKNIRSRQSKSSVKYFWSDKLFEIEADLKKRTNLSYKIGSGLVASYNNIEVQANYNFNFEKNYSSQQGSIKVKLSF